MYIDKIFIKPIDHRKQEPKTFFRARMLVVFLLAFYLVFCPVLNAQQQSCPICMTNPSFEGTACLGPNTINCPPWTQCGNTTGDSQPCQNSSPSGPNNITASNGSYFMGLAGSPATQYSSGFGESISQQLCAPLQTGVTYTVSIDLVMGNNNQNYTNPGLVSIYGGSASCAQTQLLFQQAIPTSVTAWQNYTGTFTVTSPWTYISLLGGSSATGGGFGAAYNMIDNLQILQPCATPSVAIIPVTVCAGDCAVVTASTTGGTGPYTYLWSPGGATTQSIAVFPNATTNYTVAVTDAANHTATATVTVTVNQPPSLTIVSSPASCGASNGSATVTASGGTGTYTYYWSPVGGSGSGINGLSAGTYWVEVTDAHGCKQSDTVVVTNSGGPIVSITSGNASCNGLSDGTAMASVTGGISPYTYTWLPSGGNGASATNLIAGNYTVNVNDALGCLSSQTVSIGQPAAINASTTVTSTACNGNTGSATVAVTGGAGNYTCLWLPGNQTTTNITNLAVGVYTVTVSDANGCSVNVTATVSSPGSPTVNVLSQTNVLCKGGTDGSASIAANGGNPPYTYLWSPAGGTASTATGLPAGNYSVTVTDASGCVQLKTLNISEPPVLSAVASVSGGPACAGKPVQLNCTVNGGTPAYSFLWNPGNLTGNAVQVSPFTTIVYSVTVSDAKACTTNVSVSVAVKPAPVAALEASSTSGCAPLCVTFTDKSTVVVPDVINSWIWDFGDGTVVASNGNTSHCYTLPGDKSVSLSVLSSNGCAAKVSMPAYIHVFAPPVANFQSDPVKPTTIDPYVQFLNYSGNAVSYYWNFGDENNSTSTASNPSFSFSGEDCYTVQLIALSSDGCKDTNTQQVCILPETAIYVPNSFTPNHDGQNDIFKPEGTGISNTGYELMIFDRWGNMIFKTDDLHKGWDGTIGNGKEVALIDVFIWKVNARDVLGKYYRMTGTVSLLK